MALFYAHFEKPDGSLDYDCIQTCFVSFANGELRGPATINEPNGPFFFYFAEFAFLAIEEGHHVDEWSKILRSYVKSQEVFLAVYPPIALPAGAASVPRIHRPRGFAGPAVDEDKKDELHEKYKDLDVAELADEYKKNLDAANGQASVAGHNGGDENTPLGQKNSTETTGKVVAGIGGTSALVGGGILVFGAASLATFGIGLIVVGIALLAIGLYQVFKKKPGYCEVTIVNSPARENWLQAGQKICLRCPPGENGCPGGQKQLSMWDLPLNAPEANEATDSKIEITVEYTGSGCSENCEHPQLTLLPTK